MRLSGRSTQTKALRDALLTSTKLSPSRAHQRHLTGSPNSLARNSQVPRLLEWRSPERVIVATACRAEKVAAAALVQLGEPLAFGSRGASSNGRTASPRLVPQALV